MNHHSKRFQLFYVILVAAITIFVINGIIWFMTQDNIPSIVAVGLAVTRTPNATDLFIATMASARKTLEVKETQTREAVRQMLQSPSSSGAQFPQLPPGPITPLPNAERAPTLQLLQKGAGSGTIVYGWTVRIDPQSGDPGNAWYENLVNKRLIVGTGALRDYPGELPGASKGFVQVWFENLEGDVLSVDGMYLTPTKAGLVTIVDAVGERLILKAESGMTFYFDIPSRRFVSSLTEVVPTITPIATPKSKPYP